MKQLCILMFGVCVLGGCISIQRGSVLGDDVEFISASTGGSTRFDELPEQARSCLLRSDAISMDYLTATDSDIEDLMKASCMLDVSGGRCDWIDVVGDTQQKISCSFRNASLLKEFLGFAKAAKGSLLVTRDGRLLLVVKPAVNPPKEGMWIIQDKGRTTRSSDRGKGRAGKGAPLVDH